MSIKKPVLVLAISFILVNVLLYREESANSFAYLFNEEIGSVFVFTFLVSAIPLLIHTGVSSSRLQKHSIGFSLIGYLPVLLLLAWQ